MKIYKGKSAAKFLVKLVSKTQHMHDLLSLDAILELGNLSRCIWPIIVSS